VRHYKSFSDFWSASTSHVVQFVPRDNTFNYHPERMLKTLSAGLRWEEATCACTLSGNIQHWQKLKIKFETESKPAFWIVRRNCLKGFCHEMNIFWRLIHNIKYRYFSVHALLVFTIFCFLVDEIIKLKVLTIELLKLLTNFENAFSNPL
jgi:hypothetical protein